MLLPLLMNNLMNSDDASLGPAWLDAAQVFMVGPVAVQVFQLGPVAGQVR